MWVTGSPVRYIDIDKVILENIDIDKDNPENAQNLIILQCTNTSAPSKQLVVQELFIGANKNIKIKQAARKGK